MHTQLDDPSDHGAPLEEMSGPDEDRDAEYVRRLRAFDPTHADPRRALVLMVSHIGGHKYAGNVLVRVVPRPLPSTVTPTPQSRLPSYVRRFRLT